MVHKPNLQLRQTDRVRVGVKRFEEMVNWQISAELQLWVIVRFAMRQWMESYCNHFNIQIQKMQKLIC